MPNYFGIVEYPIDYIDACFYTWYQLGDRSIGAEKLIKHLKPAPDGRIPSAATIRIWMQGGEGWQNWQQHADILDAEVSVKLDKEAIEKRAAFLRQLANDAENLKKKGFAGLEGENPFQDNPAAAVRAIVSGIELQGKYAGQADSLTIIAGMTDRQLTKEFLRLVGKNDNENEIIDAGEDVLSKPEDDND